MSKEIKIGLLAVVAITVGFFGYYFLKGKNLLDSTNIFYIEYTNTMGLQNSAPVTVNGLQVGQVYEIKLDPENPNNIIVAIEVKKSIGTPKDARAIIYSTSVMGGQAVKLIFDKFCTNDNCAKDGDYLKGSTEGLLNSMVGQDEVRDYMAVINEGVGNLLDTISKELSKDDSQVGESLHDLKVTIENLKSTTARLDRILAASGSSIEGTIKNLEAISASISSSSDEIKNIIGNTEDFSKQLSEMDLAGATAEATETLRSMKNTMKTADRALADISLITQRVKSGKGSLGLLLNDDELYSNLLITSKNLELLLQDVRLNPKRYTRFLWGKPDAYETPEADPGLNPKN